MKYKHIFFISPPFYSHFNPLITLAKSFKKLGVKVTFGCSIDFRERILNENLDFYEIDINANKNTGKAESTDQPNEEKMRLEEFFESTKKGPIETLITQSYHRKADMLYSPRELIKNINQINELLEVDLYVVDILSYSVTLSLYFLKLPFITFCPPHPNTIPAPDAHFNVPKKWPTAIKVEKSDLERLEKISSQTENEFTGVFNDIISKNESLKKVNNAFSLISDIAVIYNYFDFYNNENTKSKPYRIYAANSFEESELDNEWREKINTKEKIIMISLGTFLSNRKDVLEKLLIYTKEIYPRAQIIVSAGNNAKKLDHYSSEKIIIKDFIPQIALMPYIDTVIFHGGCNTLTESVFYGKEMIILPFSSDQFNIAYDMEKNNLAGILNPNQFTKNDLLEAFNYVNASTKDSLRHWSLISKSRGTDYAAKKILELN